MKKRQENILFIITEDFINTSIPVSSSRVMELGDLNCSTATIRNEMAFLEKCKMIEKPHISSGRIPTAKGYHYYLEHSTVGKKYRELENSIKEIFENRAASINAVIEQSCALIAEALNLPVAIFKAKKTSPNDRIQTIQLFRINELKAMIIIVSNEEVLIKKVVEVDDKVFNDLKMCLAIISKRLFNSPLNEAISRLNSIIPILKKNISIFESKLKTLIINTFKRAIMKVNVYGTAKVANLPELSNMEMFQDMMSILDEDNIWTLLSNEFSNIKGTNVKLSYIKNKRFSITSLLIDKDTTLAVIGPKRVNYSMIMAALEALKKNASKECKMLAYLGKGEKKYENKI